MGNKAIIVGAGIGGISIGILLAKKGFEVEIYEKNPFAGGRCSGFVKEGHRFDAGATMLMMPSVFKEFYSSIGKDFSKELELFRMNPNYRIWFPDGDKFDFTSDLSTLKPQFDAIEKGSYFSFLKYIKDSSPAFNKAMEKFVKRNFNSLFDMLNFKMLPVFIKIKAHKSYLKAVKQYFSNDKLRHIFTLQSFFLGLNPAEAPGVFFSLPEMELAEGVMVPKGGMKQIVENLLSIAEEFEVKVQLNSPVQGIKSENNKALGIILEDGTFHAADNVIINADLPYAYNKLLNNDSFGKRVIKKNYTCSALVFHWGIDMVFPQLQQHNVFISPDHNKYLKAVFGTGEFPDQPTFYLNSLARTDVTAAPAGNDSISVIIPISNLKNKRISWDEIKEKARKGIIESLESAGIKEIEKHIKFEVIYTPEDWKNVFNLSFGSTFGSLSHKLLQMGYLRPSNQHRKIKNLFFVGGSTHPGNGVPMTMISARLTTENIIKATKI